MASSRKAPSAELLEKARVELKEVQSEVPEQIQALREKILENPEFNFRTDDEFLLRFLRAKKFDQKRALELTTNYYKQRDNYPKFFRKSASSGLVAALNSNFQGVLFERDAEGRAIAVFKSAAHWEPNLFSLDDLLAHFGASLERIIEDEETQINGIVILVNCKGFDTTRLLNLSPFGLKKAASVLMNCFPIRYKAIHFINEPYLFDAMFSLVKPLLTAKILSRVVLHGTNLKSLHEHISPSILPQEFGGHLGPYDNSAWSQVLIEHEETFRRNLQFGFVRKK